MFVKLRTIHDEVFILPVNEIYYVNQIKNPLQAQEKPLEERDIVTKLVCHPMVNDRIDKEHNPPLIVCTERDIDDVFNDILEAVNMLERVEIPEELKTFKSLQS